ncbi:MAG: type III-A CRISPR-associated RAMP protein Csm4 [Candidatus Bathyarchaeia archaeon]
MGDHTAILMEFLSPLHVGEKGVGLEEASPTIRSDTLFGALCWAIRHTQGNDELEGLLNLFRESRPPFLLSSTFPWIAFNDERIFFLPKPKKPLYSGKEAGIAKEEKKVSFLQREIFEKAIASEDLGNTATLGPFLVDEKMEPFLKDRIEAFRKRSEVHRNVLDRLSLSSDVYHVGAILYEKRGGGLYFLIRCFDVSLRSIRMALRYLEESGIGGERNLGYGRFRHRETPFQIKEPQDAEYIVSLSLYHPTREEASFYSMHREELYYTMATRAGFAEIDPGIGGLLRREVRMFEEGSVFPKIQGRRLYGGLPETLKKEDTRSHPIFTYGFAYPISMRGDNFGIFLGGFEGKFLYLASDPSSLGVDDNHDL